MDDGFCLDCKVYTTVVFDHRSGDAICSECGLVLEARTADQTSEWRTFVDDSDNHKDPNRVGFSSNPLLNAGGLGTVIKQNNVSGDSLSQSVGRWHRVVKDQDGPLIHAFNTIAAMGGSLGLVKTITNHANEFYKKADDQRVCKGRNLNAIMAACLFFACQEEGFPRTIKEISTVANGSTIKEINRAKKVLKERLEIGTRVIQAADLVKRFCSNLGMKHQAVKAVQEIVEKINDFDIRRNATSILAAVIYMITQLSSDNNKLPLRDILHVTEVAEGTMKGTYKDLYPYASRLVPDWYAKVEDLKKLCPP